MRSAACLMLLAAVVAATMLVLAPEETRAQSPTAAGGAADTSPLVRRSPDPAPQRRRQQQQRQVATQSGNQQRQQPQQQQRQRGPAGNNAAAGRNGDKNRNQQGAGQATLANGPAFCQGVLAAGKMAGGSCSQTVQGTLPDFNRMISTVITSPKNGAKIRAGQDVSIKTVIQNLQPAGQGTGNFFNQPQALNNQKIVQGRQQIVAQLMADNAQAAIQPLNPNRFQVFAELAPTGRNAQRGNNRVFQFQQTLSGQSFQQPGMYRICTLTQTVSQQPVLMPVAKRGSQDDCVRVQVQ